MNRISLTLLAGVAVLSMASATQAADLLIQQPASPGFIDMGGSSGGWDGAYVGGFAGFGWGTVLDDDGVIGLDDDELDLSGWTVGATLGANFTVAPGFILGAAGDMAWANYNGYDDVTDFDYEVNWTGAYPRQGRLRRRRVHALRDRLVWLSPVPTGGDARRRQHPDAFRLDRRCGRRGCGRRQCVARPAVPLHRLRHWPTTTCRATRRSTSTPTRSPVA